MGTAAKNESSKNISTAPMSFNVSQLKGIHKVTKAPERVWIGNLWSIEVPVGFTYTVDPEKAGSGAQGTYQLHIQSSKDCDFDAPYSSVFNVVVYGMMHIINRNSDDMGDEGMLQTLDDLSSHVFGDYQLYKCSRDLVVYYEAFEESEEYTAYNFQVMTRGSALVFNGQFNLQTGTISERKKNILQWLDTIDVLTQDERLSFTNYSGKSKGKIPTEYGKAMATIDPGIKISIPHGFHAETNQAVIGENRKLVIVPKSYSLSADPMEAPVALSLSHVVNGIPTRADSFDKYFEFFCEHSTAFSKECDTYMYKNSDKAFTISQITYGDGDVGRCYSKTVSMLFANDSVYGVHLIINYPEDEYDVELACWDIIHLSNAWLARIQVDGETVPEYPSRGSSASVKKSLPAEAKATPARDLYPHYDQLGNTAVPNTRSGGLVIVTNAGGTEFESYPFSYFCEDSDDDFDGAFKAVAERVISKDSCSKEFKQLVVTATTYAALFRVSEGKFNPKEDRECDIRNLRMRRAYQLHVLRSFAWTLAEQASLQQKSLSDLEVDEYQMIFSAIEKKKFLNYQGDSHFPTLCGTADLHVFFVPDKTTKADKEALNDTGSIGSLEGLRKDLLALAEPMEKLFQWLLSTRDYSEPLTGTGADALYAWCTLVLSAETPFYIEDGPMTCWYAQITDPPVPAKAAEKKQGKTTKKSAKGTSTSPQTRGEDVKGFPIAEVEDSCKRLLNRKPKKTDSPNRFDLYLYKQEHQTGFILYYFGKVWPGYSDEREELLHSADEMVKLFRDDSLESDVESELRQGYIRNVRTLHVLRSFVWTIVEYCEMNKVVLPEFSLEQSVDLAQFIFDRGGANYKVANIKKSRIGAALLKKVEKKFTFFGETQVSLVQSLHTLLPVMKRIYDYLLEKTDGLSDADLTLKDILAGWCAFSLACFTGFNVEAGPEDYIPQKCRELPVDTDYLRVIDGCYYVDQNNCCVAYTGSGDLIDFPEGIKSVRIPKEYSNISGSREYWNHTGTIVFPTTWDSNIYNDTCSQFVKRLVIKCNTDSIYVGGSFKECEEIEFTGKVNTISSRSFNYYSNLRKVILPENLTVIEEEAFFDAPMKEIRIPSNVKEIGMDAFGHMDENFTVLIVEKGSVAEETVRNYIANKDNFDLADKNSVRMKVVLSESEQKLQAFEQQIRSLVALSKQPLIPRIENGDDKKVIVGQIVSRANALIGDGALLSSGLAQYDGNAELETLKLTLGQNFASAGEIIDAINAKKSAEYDRLSALLEKKNTDIGIAQQEIAKLEEERSHLGIFQGKRKKEIATLLEQLKARIKHIEDDYEYAKKHI